MKKPCEIQTSFKIVMIKTNVDLGDGKIYEHCKFAMVDEFNSIKFTLPTFNYNPDIHKQNIADPFNNNQELAAQNFNELIQLDLYQYFMESIKQAIDNFEILDFIDLDGTVKDTVEVSPL